MEFPHSMGPVNVSFGHVNTENTLGMILTYAPDTSFDLYLFNSLFNTFFIAYLATSCVMMAVLVY